MDIHRLGSEIQPDLSEPDAEPAAARNPATLHIAPISLPGTDLAGATPMPLPGTDVISATPMPLPGTDLAGATPMPLPGPGPDGASVFGLGLRAERDEPPASAPEPDRNLLSPRLGAELLKAQLLHTLETPGPGKAEQAPPDRLRKTDDGSDASGPAGVPGTRSDDDGDGEYPEEIQL